METITISEFSSNVKRYLDKVSDNNNELIINRSGGKSVVVISLEEYNSWKETSYLLSSKTNSERLQRSIIELDETGGTKIEIKL